MITFDPVKLAANIAGNAALSAEEKQKLLAIVNARAAVESQWAATRAETHRLNAATPLLTSPPPTKE